MNKMSSEIDFVITWVDGADLEWQKTKAKYNPDKTVDASVSRYRDWGLLRYWFRSVEEFAPWVRTIHFITCGHLPNWLNTDNPKLHIVRHEDYLPPEALPCFNSNAIELSMHRIEGLSEQFVYFNDDMFLIDYVEPQDFFENGLPVDDAVFSPVMPVWGDDIGKTLLNNMYIINKHFDKNDVLKRYRSKFLSLKYGKQLFRTICLLPWRHFPGFFNDHLPIAYLKSTFDEVWRAEGELLSTVTTHKFRSYHSDISHWLMRYWQFCTGKFVPISPKRGMDMDIESLDTIRNIKKQCYKMVCLNDKTTIESDYPNIQSGLSNAFEFILQKKSEFEI